MCFLTMHLQKTSDLIHCNQEPCMECVASYLPIIKKDLGKYMYMHYMCMQHVLCLTYMYM